MILVTGGGGFVGSRLCKMLDEKGVSYEAPGVEELNLLNSASVTSWFEYHRPRVVIHLAAVFGGIAFNKAHADRILRENSKITTSLFDAIPKHVRLIQLSSAAVYGEPAQPPFREDDYWNSTSESANRSYVLPKMLSTWYADTHLDSSLTLVPANVYGPNERYGSIEEANVIPAIILKALDAVAHGRDSIELFGDGTAIREFIYVDDLCSSILAAIDSNATGLINIGSDMRLSIRDLASLILGQLGLNLRVKWSADRPSGNPVRTLDHTRMRDMLCFSPATAPDEGIRNVIEAMTARHK